MSLTARKELSASRQTGVKNELNMWALEVLWKELAKEVFS